MEVNKELVSIIRELLEAIRHLDRRTESNLLWNDFPKTLDGIEEKINELELTDEVPA